ncbi:MAG: PH domain-containing protein [Bacteroidota bacterium]
MSSVFTNPTVDVQALPQVEEAEFQGLDEKYLNVSLIGSIIGNALFLIPVSVGIYFATANGMLWLGLLGLSLWALYFAFRLFLLVKGFRKKAYAVRERDLIYKKGLIWQRTTTVPFTRIQHASVSEGPIEKLFGLATVKVFTAGGDSSDLSIPGLPHEAAHRMKDFVMEKAGRHESA